MSTELIKAIGLLNEDKPYRIQICFNFDGEPLSVSINMYDKNGNRIYDCIHDIVDRNKWDRMGKSIGRNTSLRELTLWIYNDDNIISEASECLEAFCRGVEGNSSVEMLDIDVDLFSNIRGSPSIEHS